MGFCRGVITYMQQTLLGVAKLFASGEIGKLADEVLNSGDHWL